MVYVPYWFRSRQTASLVVRSPLDRSVIASAVRRAAAAFDSEIAIARVRTLQQLVDDALASRRYQVAVFVVCGAVGFLIAVIGVYAMTAYGVSRRRREMNIRVALGGSRRELLALILRQTTIPLAIGVAAGVAGSVAIGAIIASLLFEMSARDPRVITLVAVMVGSVGVAAALIAARNGLIVNPAAALRED
jgi:putative ABC transport system permease protein